MSTNPRPHLIPKLNPKPVRYIRPKLPLEQEIKEYHPEHLSRTESLIVLLVVVAILAALLLLKPMFLF